MSEEKNTPLSLLQKMKQNAKVQKPYGGKYVAEPAKVNVRTCPGCGAGRTEQDGLTHCAYCKFEFLSGALTDGIYIKKEDNSQNIK